MLTPTWRSWLRHADLSADERAVVARLRLASWPHPTPQGAEAWVAQQDVDLAGELGQGQGTIRDTATVERLVLRWQRAQHSGRA